MKAFTYQKYGPPEALRMGEVDKPAPNANEVLVKVRAVSVNAADWHALRGKPLFSRATLGLLRPKHQLLGVDIAGQVEAVGSGVTRYQPGDEVYANLLDHGYGGFADYVSVPAEVMALKPANLSFEEAAAVPMPRSPPSRASATTERSSPASRSWSTAVRAESAASRSSSPRPPGPR
jgi:NADPH:quinone reductase-like Zn-dependent oxidoreductase